MRRSKRWNKALLFWTTCWATCSAIQDNFNLHALDGDLRSARDRKLSAEFHQEQPPFRNDVVVVLPSTISRSAIVKATQKSRRGVRTFVVNDRGPALDGNGIAKKQILLRISHRPQVFGAYIGSGLKQAPQHLTELRIALAPFLANVTLGIHSFKWLLFGHDDTVWMVENTLKLLRGLDHDQPHLITDNLWFQNSTQEAEHPHGDAPFCLPCQSKGYTDIRMHKEGGTWKCILNGKEAPTGCPCSRKNLALNAIGKRLLDPETLDFRDAQAKASFRLHLGGGIILSRGFFQLASFDSIHSWMKERSSQFANADALFTSVVWDLLKMAPSKPGYDYCKPGLTVFDPGWADSRLRTRGDSGKDAGNDPIGVVQRLEGALRDEDSCDKACVTRLDNMVTVHVRQPLATKDLPPHLAGIQDRAPRFNATVSLINMLTQRSEEFQRQRWAEEQSFFAAGNK